MSSHSEFSYEFSRHVYKLKLESLLFKASYQSVLARMNNEFYLYIELLEYMYIIYFVTIIYAIVIRRKSGGIRKNVQWGCAETDPSVVMR